MIFGKSKEEKHKERILEACRKTLTKKKFAFLPTYITDGRWIWLEDYYEKKEYIYVTSDKWCQLAKTGWLNLQIYREVEYTPAFQLHDERLKYIMGKDD